MSMLSFVNGLHLFKSLLFCGRTGHVLRQKKIKFEIQNKWAKNQNNMWFDSCLCVNACMSTLK